MEYYTCIILVSCIFEVRAMKVLFSVAIDLPTYRLLYYHRKSTCGE